MSVELEQFVRRSAALIDAPWWPALTARVTEAMATDGAHDWTHLGRVLINARAIFEADAEALGLGAEDWPAIAAAVLCHDVINLPKDHPERHTASALSGRWAAAELAALGVGDEAWRARVAEAIRAHSFSANVATDDPLAHIVQDADRLESLGAIGLARTFATGGALGRPPASLDDPLGHSRPLDDLMWSADHLPAKLLTLAARMKTPSGRARAAQRHAFIEAFRAQLGAELSGET